MLVGSNGGKLMGKYGIGMLDSMNFPSSGYPPVADFYSSNNDFQVNFLGDSNVPPREALLWSSETQMFYDVQNYRENFLNDPFIEELQLPAAIASNLKQRQFRPDLNVVEGSSGSPPRSGRPWLIVHETNLPQDFNIRLDPNDNSEHASERNRGPFDPLLSCRHFRFPMTPK